MSLANTCCRLARIKINDIHVLGGYVSRSATTIADYKIEWVRPRKICPTDPEQSGDLGLDIKLNPTEYRRYYAQSKELEDASDIVKKMFTLQFQHKKQSNIIKIERAIERVKRHKQDGNSPETKIAAMTSEIQILQEYIKDHPRNMRVKQFLKELIEERGKYLKNMRKWDYRRFEWLLERLNLIYRPRPEVLGKVSRKDSLRALTETYCDDIKKKKLDAYKAELDAQKKLFYHEKAEKLAFIRKEEIECGLTPSVSEEEIEKTREMAKKM